MYESRGLPAGIRPGSRLVLATMHGSWGFGFLTSPARLAEPTERATPTKPEK